MSIEQVQAFMQDVLENPWMKDDVVKCSTIEERLTFATSNGYGVTIDDFREVAATFNSGFKKCETPDSGGRLLWNESSCYQYHPAPKMV